MPFRKPYLEIFARLKKIKKTKGGYMKTTNNKNAIIMEQNTNTTNRPQGIGISTYKEIGRKRYYLTIRLSDECKNGFFEFFVRMETKEKKMHGMT